MPTADLSCPERTSPRSSPSKPRPRALNPLRCPCILRWPICTNRPTPLAAAAGVWAWGGRGLGEAAKAESEMGQELILANSPDSAARETIAMTQVRKFKHQHARVRSCLCRDASAWSADDDQVAEHPKLSSGLSHLGKPPIIPQNQARAESSPLESCNV